MEGLGMWQQVGFLADVFAVFARHGLSIDLVATSETNVTVSLDASANLLESSTLDAVLADLSTRCNPRLIAPCATLSLVGTRIRSILHRLGPALELFEEEQVHLVSQAASDLNLTFVVDQDQIERLLVRLHAQLFSGIPDEEVFGPSWQEQFNRTERPAAPGRAWWQRRRAELLALAERESPLYVYDRACLEEAGRQLQALASVDRVLYAVKANPNREILQIFEGLGLGFECVSPGELALVRRLFPQLPPERVLYTPNFASEAEYQAGFTHGATVTLDNPEPLDSWPQVFQGREVFLRLDLGRGAGHHRHVRTAGTRSKFGIPLEKIGALRERLAALDIRVAGLHSHSGSGIRTPESWACAAASLAEVARDFPTVRVLDLGGGLGVPERPGELNFDLHALGQQLAAFRSSQPGFQIWLEPGRHLVAQAGILLVLVNQTKQKGDKHFVGVNTGMNSLIRPALYGAYHEIANLTRLDEPASMVADVVGPICETGDILGHDRRLPPTRPGDVLLIATTGAYGRAMSSCYNLREPAGELLI
jgi:diaminopimelate decarboxylase/aspartate kinase